MIRKKPAPDWIRGGRRFAEKIMLQNSKAYPLVAPGASDGAKMLSR
jgi:hypothetical protein